jgi:hypothetical protein
MMDNLQEAYTSYQQALYHLRDPKVRAFSHTLSLYKANRGVPTGTQTLVRNWYLI